MTSGRRRLAAATAALALLVGCSQAGARHPEPSSVTSTPARDRTAGGVDAARGFRSTRDYRATPMPVRVEIPSIGVTSSLDRLGRAPDGTVEVPSDWEVAGWYAPGPRPGDPGSAVILGHVDSKRGPAVFYRLPQLRRGDQIKVVRADGSSVRFIVERTAQYPKDRFPNRRGVLPHPDPGAAAGDLRRGLRRHRWPLPVQCGRLRHHAQLTCPA